MQEGQGAGWVFVQRAQFTAMFKLFNMYVYNNINYLAT